jgi:hypothetical protein
MKRKLTVIRPDRVTCHPIDPSLYEGWLPFVSPPAVDICVRARLLSTSYGAPMTAEPLVPTGAEGTCAAGKEAELRALRSP